MKKIAITSFIIIAVCVTSFLLYRKFTSPVFGQWVIQNNKDTAISWIPFTWEGDSLNHRYFDKLSISVPVKLEGGSGNFTCQLDLGSNLTVLYEHPLKPYLNEQGLLFGKRAYFSDHLFGGIKHLYLSDIPLHMGETTVSSNAVFIYENYGDTTQTDTPTIGTIGVDIFRDKILIMDYPRQRMCIIDSLPQAYHSRLFDMELNKHGFIIIPVTVGGRTYRVMYDSGSSMFSLLTSSEQVAAFSKESNSDTLLINAWGKQERVISRMMKDTLVIAGRSYSNLVVYYSQTLGAFLKDSNADAITGNALFWNNVLVLDFKHRKIGIL